MNCLERLSRTTLNLWAKSTVRQNDLNSVKRIRHPHVLMLFFSALFVFCKSGILYNDPIIFKCNKQNFPDLPEWLRFTQRNPYDNGFLYGTPMSPGKSIIEVWNHHLHQHWHNILPCCTSNIHLWPYFCTFFCRDGRPNKDNIPAQLVETNMKNMRLSKTAVRICCQIPRDKSLGPLLFSCYFEPTLKIQEVSCLWRRRRDTNVRSNTLVSTKQNLFQLENMLNFWCKHRTQLYSDSKLFPL